jgi:hypothetical protein
VEYLHTLNNFMPKELANVKEAHIKACRAMAAYAMGAHASSPGVLPHDGVLLNDFEVGLCKHAVVGGDAEGKFDSYLKLVGTKKSDRKDWGDDDWDKELVPHAIVALGRLRAVLDGLSG